MVREKQQVKDHQSCISAFLAYLTIPTPGAPAQTWQQYSIRGRMVDLYRNRATSGERNFIERIKAPIFLEAVLTIEIM